MRLGVRRLLGVSALYLLFGLYLPGCSSQQQDDESLDVSGQENSENGDGQEASNSEDSDSNSEMNNEDSNSDNSNSDEMSNDNSEDSADAGNATENDLQEIIQEMNGQQTADTGDMAEATDTTADANALATDAGMAGDTSAMATDSSMAANTAPAGDMAANTATSTPMPFQPGGSPAAPGLPEVGSKMAYIVESGDTLGKISQKIYGSPGRWNELATLSGIANPSRIYPGDLVYYTLDESAVPFATAYESVQRATETVQQGDTLATIAQRVYGTSKGWRSIWRNNDKIDNPDLLTAGTAVYYVPKGAATAAINKIKTNIAKVSKKSLDQAKKIAAKVAKKTKSIKVTQVSFDLGANNISNLNTLFGSNVYLAI